MSDAGDEADEVDETPGVEEWLAVESEAEAVSDGLDGTPSEEQRSDASVGVDDSADVEVVEHDEADTVANADRAGGR